MEKERCGGGGNGGCWVGWVCSPYRVAGEKKCCGKRAVGGKLTVTLFLLLCAVEVAKKVIVFIES